MRNLVHLACPSCDIYTTESEGYLEQLKGDKITCVNPGCGATHDVAAMREHGETIWSKKAPLGAKVTPGARRSPNRPKDRGC